MIGSKKQLAKIIGEDELKALIPQYDIPGVSMAYIDNNTSSPVHAGVTNTGEVVTATTRFGAASLSKPIFAYLILKLAQAGKIDLDARFDETFISDESLDIILRRDQSDGTFSKNIASDDFKSLTPRIILLHRTGLPITAGLDEPLNFEFEPGSKYGYSGIAYQCLQEAIEKQTGRTLEVLAQEYVFDSIGMDNSSFGRVAANSLQTTATDYAKFINYWMRDESLDNAFQFDDSFNMHNDPWAVGLKDIEQDELQLTKLESADLNKVGWGLGFGLQKNSDGITAFHSGDSTDCRALVAFNLKNKTGVVFFANSDNGLALADKIIPQTAETTGLEHGLNYLFQKYGFERYFQEGWEERQTNRIGEICGHYPRNKSYLEAAIPIKQPSQKKVAPLVNAYASQSAMPGNGVIAQLLHSATSMGLNPETYMRNQGFNPELPENIKEIAKLAQNGNNEAAFMVLESLAENKEHASPLAQRLLSSVKNIKKDAT